MEWRSPQAQSFAPRISPVEFVGGFSEVELSEEGVGLSHSTIRAQGAVAEVRGRCRIRANLVRPGLLGQPDCAHRDHRRWTAFTWVR
jgi:hypothetical protein